MKNYNLKFGLQYKNNIWHVTISSNKTQLAADCMSSIFMGDIKDEPRNYIHPILHSLYSREEIHNIDLNYKNLCLKCKKKFNLTQEDINHYIVLAKFKVKI